MKSKKQTKTIDQTVTIADDEFYYVKQDFGEVDMPFKLYNVLKSSKDVYITGMSCGIDSDGDFKLVYTLNNDEKLDKDYVFKTREQASSYARELNEQVIYDVLSDVKSAITLLAKLDLINLSGGEFNALMWFVGNRMEEIEKTRQVEETDETESIQRKNKA